MKGFVSDLPAEIRLVIYEHLLGFDYPLKRIKPIDELDGTMDDELRQYVRGDRINISIMFACKKTYNEAVAVLYQLNTMSLCHDDVCLLTRERGFTRGDRELLQKVLVVDWFESGPWTTCTRCSKDIVPFLEVFNNSNLPKLKAVTLDLERFRGGYTALGEQLLKAGLDVTFDFTAVGCFTLRKTQPTIHFRFNTIVSLWAYYSVIPPVFDEEGQFNIPEQFRGFERKIVNYVCHIRWRYNEYCLSKTPSQLLSQALAAQEVDLRWLEPDNQGPETYEKLTKQLVHMMNLLAFIMRRDTASGIF